MLTNSNLIKIKIQLAQNCVQNKISIIFLAFVILFSGNIIAQDSTKSVVIKNNQQTRKYPLIKPQYPSYPLISGYLLVKEANEGDPFAEHELGLRFLLGRGFPKDTTEAVRWIKKAVDKNLTVAQFNYGIMLNTGTGTDWNPFEAFKNFKSAAESGMAESQYAVGIFYTDNLVVNRDYNKAYAWIKEAANYGLDYAKETLKQIEDAGLINKENTNTSSIIGYDENLFTTDSASLMPQDWQFDFIDFENDTLSEEEQIASIKELLNKNKTELKSILGVADESNFNQADDTSSTGLIKLAADNGSPEALFITGKSYQRGIGREKDSVLALSYFIRSFRLGSGKGAEAIISYIQSPAIFKMLQNEIDNGNPDAMYSWAGLTAMGFDYQLNYDQALELLEKAAAKNHIPSLIEMGLSYYSGTIVTKDKNKAIEYWSKAADLGSREARVRIAFTNLLENEFDRKDIIVLVSASDEGSVLAQTALGYCYENGIGVKKDKAAAAKYYRLAAIRGNKTAFTSLKNMYDEIRPDDEEFQILVN